MRELHEMDENPWKSIYLMLMILIALLLAVTFCASTVFADDSTTPPGPPPGPPPTAQGLVQGDYLYVLEMRAIHQYYLNDMSLKQTVALPDLPVPATSAVTDGRPPMPPRASFLVEGSALFVIEMRSIYKYTLPSLVLEASGTLPAPELPQ